MEVDEQQNVVEEEIEANGTHQQAPMLELGDQPSKEFLDLFAKMDSTVSGELIEKAWKHYDTIGQQIILEGNQSVWMACSFFTTVWQATPIGHELICKYSLSKLLDICEVSVLEFFDKLNNWADMLIASRRLLDYTGRVQSNLAIAVVIYKKFLRIFRHVFANVAAAQAHTRSPHRPKYASPVQKLSTTALFEFTWTMFIALRKQLSPSQEDLMHSFNLLLCVVDYLVRALEELGMQKLVNPTFARAISAKDQTPLEYLCEMMEGVTLDAKHLRTHWMLPRLQRLYSEDTIIGEQATQILTNFEDNQRALDHLYVQKMLVRSEVDERIFVGPALANIGRVFDGELDDSVLSVMRRFGKTAEPEQQPQMIDVDLLLKVRTQNCLAKLGGQRAPAKPPLAGRSYVITPETVCPNITLASSEAKQPQKMRELLADFKGADDTLLSYLFEDCRERGPREFVAEQLHSFSQKFAARIGEEKRTADAPNDADFESNLQRHIADIELLFYFLLQKVVSYDRERAVSVGMEMQLDLGVIFHNVEFLASVYLCAAELTLCAHESERRRFPWTAHLFSDVVGPLNFYKIFELVVRADTGLSKQAIKHLNKVEESVLEELAWAGESPIWRILEESCSVESFGELSNVPGSQILSRSSVYTQRNIDLPQPIIIFFKKVYHLATIRLTDLCERVRLMEELTRHKMWTLFEYVFRTHTQLIRDRHLDQLLMCCLYIVAKLCNMDTSFQEIMYHYRHQPQSSGRIYRKVLIADSPSAVGATSKPTAGGTKEYADLIKFYNRVFVPCVEEHVKLLHPTGPDSKENIVPLIPIPKVALNPLSPRKSLTDRINVIPMSQYASQFVAARPPRNRYDFHRSPSKDLKSINSMVGGGSSHFFAPSQL